MTAGVLSVVAVVLGALMSLLGFMAVVIFNDIRKELGTLRRHVESMLHVQWQLIWRTNALEDFLEERMEYTPPRVIGNAESRG